MSTGIDLHIHSRYSDGFCSPAEILDIVRRLQLTGFSITDHDTLEGYREAKKLLIEGDPELVSGVELSVSMENEDLHMLAYFFDPDNTALNAALAGFQEYRFARGKKIIEKLGELGLDVPYEAVLKTANNSVVGRPHIAETMYRLNLTSEYDEAFRKYIGRNGPAYVPKAKIGPEEAIAMIHGAGGVAVLAHPLLDNMIRFVDQLSALGLDGIEVYHYTTTAKEVRHIKRVAKRHGLVLSGGSDFHGRDGRTEDIGSQQVPAEYLNGLQERATNIRGRH